MRPIAGAGSRCCRNNQRKIGIEESGERPHQKLDQRQAESIATAEIRIGSAMNWTISCLRVAPSTLRNATSRARWPARAVARLVKLTTAMPRISSAMIAKVVIDRPVVARRHRSALRLAEVDVAKVDEVPILVVAVVIADSPLGSSGMLRFSQAGSCASIP